MWEVDGCNNGIRCKCVCYVWNVKNFISHIPCIPQVTSHVLCVTDKEIATMAQVRRPKHMNPCIVSCIIMNYTLASIDIKNIFPYTLRPHALRVPAVAHVYAKSSMVYKLLIVKNRIAVTDKIALRGID